MLYYELDGVSIKIFFVLMICLGKFHSQRCKQKKKCFPLLKRNKVEKKLDKD